MKRKIALAFGAALLTATVSAFVYVNNERNPMDEIFNANVDALAEQEIGITGHCEEVSGDCIAFCPVCGSAVWAPGHQGPAYGLSGSCANCE